MARFKFVVAAVVLSMVAMLSPGLAGGAGAAPDRAPTFIVTLRSGEPREVAAEHARRYGAEVEFVYEHALQGYAARVSEGQIGALARDGRVARVERDQAVQAVETTQSNATWGLDRIDQRALPLSGTYSSTSTGAGVTAYIVDTGIRTSHADLGGRSTVGTDVFTDGQDGQDCNGHGTHVAGTVGGSEYGVAKGVALVAVRVLDCKGSGTWSGVIAGLDWIVGNHAAGTPAVANMSLGGGASTSVDDAVNRVIADGVAMVVAAGNGDRLGRAQDACNYSPARVPDAMTIGATTQSDAKTSWSNYGSCVDWFAPGAGITSAWYTSDTATNTISGTSMAAPHVAGAAALFLGENTAASASQVREALYAATSKGVVTASSTATNHLLYTGAETSLNAPPTAAFTYSCAQQTCSFTDGSFDGDGGEISSWTWSFGDGVGSTERHPSHLFASSGTYTVTLTVTDGQGATDTTSQSVSVLQPSGDGITLQANAYKVKGNKRVDLTWAGATSTNVNVHRGSSVTTTANDGAHTDVIDGKGGGSYTYTVCDTTTSICSAPVTVTF